VRYYLTDSAGAEDWAWVYIRVKDGPSAPTCVPKTFTTNRNTALTGSVACTDKNGDTLTHTVVEEPASGTLQLAADGTFEFAPPPEFVGTAQFRVKASDGALESEPATIKVVVAPENRAPGCTDVTVSGEEDQPVELTLP